ncbi:MAG: tol-pal system protein YbgF [Alphaproteobacteria bacterium]|nr:tol-pal system protein YbgF [Alphaproteobacteria bacterium]HPF46886.1 tol-pal system protein YbgF [Emcibacteraceae bacterium]HRW29533.1 tol-pal system protein YbgF [Emcibacteraceae bacterium]
MLKNFLIMKNILPGFLVFSLSAVILLGTTGHASAQSTRERLTAIEKQLNALQRRVFTPGSRFQSGDDNSGNDTSANAGSVVSTVPAGSEGQLIAEINIRISELETQLRQMTGKVEEANFKVENMVRQLETMQKDYEFRFAELEKGAGAGTLPTMGAAAASVPTGGAPLPSGTPKQQYDYAYGLVSNAQYEQAEISFLEFLKAHPDDELAGNAQYWLGQTYYARGNYTDATRTFLEGMSKYPDSTKAPAYLLKVGMSLNLLGEKQEACEVYRELNARFPNSSENTRMRPVEERKAGCN